METSWCEHAAIRNIEPMAWNPSHSAQLVTSQTPDKGEVNGNRTNLSHSRYLLHHGLDRWRRRSHVCRLHACM